MRFMIACLAAVAAVAFAAPSFAQDATPAPTPMAKPKVGTAAYCNSLKTTSSKTACLKRLQASAAKPAATPATTTAHKAKTKKPATEAVAPKETSALAPPPPAMTAPKPVQQAQPSTIVVPPLPQKTI